MAEVERGGDRPVASAPAHFLIVEAPYYAEVGALLRRGAEAVFAAAGSTVDIVQVPGALEIPAAVAILVEGARRQGRPYAGVVALGCVMRGETYHFEVVSNESARGLTLIGIEKTLPIGNGILTVETEAQAVRRADPAAGDKGGEAAHAAIALWRLAQRAGEGAA